MTLALPNAIVTPSNDTAIRVNNAVAVRGGIENLHDIGKPIGDRRTDRTGRVGNLGFAVDDVDGKGFLLRIADLGRSPPGEIDGAHRALADHVRVVFDLGRGP